MIGTLIKDRYRIDSELGQGGMGVVYQAHDLLLGRNVAVKVLNKGGKLGLDTEGRVRLLHEAKAAAQLNHPSIVSIFDAGEAVVPGNASPSPYIVLELLEGESLYDHPLRDLDAILAAARQVSAALEHAHTHGIIHRDLKPENIIVAKDGTVKLMDFGLARSLVSRQSQEGMVVGTVFYLAPETALRREVDGRSDLYSLGVILYELVTGVLPFTADDPLAVISQHLYAPVVPPRALRPDLPQPLNDLIVQLLNKSPEDRPASAGEVRRLLEGMESTGQRTFFASGPDLPALDRLVRGRLVARERELAELSAAWELASSGQGHTLLVSGEPGIGKTRLVRELMARVGVSGGRVLAGNCYTEGDLPYAPFPTLLLETLGSATSDLQLPGYVLADLAVIAPELNAARLEKQVIDSTEPQAEQRRIYDSMLAWLSSLTQAAPVLLFLDDVHWADSDALYIVRHLARKADRLRLLIVLTYREIELNGAGALHSVLSDFHRERLATRVKLTRLNRQQTGEMLATILNPVGKIASGLIDSIYRETEGNPFFVEEVTKALVEEGKLCYEEVCWVTKNAEEIEIPQSVRLTIQTRLERLPERTQEILRMASILGREFEVDTLEKAVDLDEEILIDALEEAERAQIIEERPRGKGKGPVFSFVHALIASTLRDSISGLRRQRLHRRAAQAIEAANQSKNGGPDHGLHLEALADHYEQAGAGERAQAYYRLAGDRALKVFASQEAERYYRAAMEIEGLDESRVDLLAGLGEALFRQSQYLQAVDVWREAIRILLASRDTDRLAHLYARTARATWYAGDAPGGLAICREALDRIRQLDPASDSAETPGMAALLHETARALRFNNMYDEALSLCRRALALAERLGLIEVQAETLATLGILDNQDPEQARQALLRAVYLAEEAGLLTVAARAHLNLAQPLQNLGDFVGAYDHAQQARKLGHQMGIVDWEFTFLISTMDAALTMGKLEEVESEIAALHDLAAHIPNLGCQPLMAFLIEAALRNRQGKWEQAIDVLMARFQEVQECKEPSLYLSVVTELGLALMELNRLDEAVQILLGMDNLAEEPYPLDRLMPLFLLSMVRSRQGQAAQALPYLQEAREILQTYPSASYGTTLEWAEACQARFEARWDNSLEHYARAIEQTSSYGMIWNQARILLDLAETHRSRSQEGDVEHAKRLACKGRDIFQRIKAVGYVNRIPG